MTITRVPRRRREQFFAERIQAVDALGQLRLFDADRIEHALGPCTSDLRGLIVGEVLKRFPIFRDGGFFPPRDLGRAPGDLAEARTEGLGEHVIAGGDFADGEELKHRAWIDADQDEFSIGHDQGQGPHRSRSIARSIRVKRPGKNVNIQLRCQVDQARGFRQTVADEFLRAR